MQPIQPPDAHGASGAFGPGIRLSLPASLGPGNLQAGGSATNSGQITPSGVAGVIGTSASSILSVTSNSTSMTLMSQQVGEFLGGIDQALANNEYLKLLLAAIIMSVLLGEGDAQSTQNAMQMLEALSGSQSSAMYISIESTSQSVSIQQSSQALMSAEALTSFNSGAGQGDQGQNLDLSA